MPVVSLDLHWMGRNSIGPRTEAGGRNPAKAWEVDVDLHRNRERWTGIEHFLETITSRDSLVGMAPPVWSLPFESEDVPAAKELRS